MANMINVSTEALEAVRAYAKLRKIEPSEAATRLITIGVGRVNALTRHRTSRAGIAPKGGKKGAKKGKVA